MQIRNNCGETIESIKREIEALKASPRTFTYKANMALLRRRLKTLEKKVK